MIRAAGLVALALLLLLASPVMAQRPVALEAQTAGELADLCAARPDNARADAAINFCHGFAQGAVKVAVTLLRDKKLFCFPDPAPSRTATLNEYVSWVRAVPTRRSQPALEGLFKFLGERFPCN